jgi:protein TonB
MADRGRDWREAVGSAIAALRRRPRAVFLASCLSVLLGSWWGTMFFADRLVTDLPDRSGPLSPLPLTEQEIEQQVRRAQQLNDELRAQRAAARAYTRSDIGGLALGDSASAGEALDGDGAPQRPLDDRRSHPAPSEFVPTDTPAEPVYTVAPTYPEVGRAMSASGTVVVQALIGKDGRVADTRVLKSIPALDDAAEDAVRRWRFKPAQADGVPVETWVSVPIQFRR